eukprot:Platyproteum_vivax@DN10558_c0_g1_i1.p1
MSQASPDVIWRCLRKNSAFTKKCNGRVLTREPGNLVNIHCRKYCGLLEKSVNIEADKGKLRLVTRWKKPRAVKLLSKRQRLSYNDAESKKKIEKSLFGFRKDLRVAAYKRFLACRSVALRPVPAAKGDAMDDK